MYIVFYEKKDSILEPGYGGRRDKWGGETYSAVPAKTNFSEGFWSEILYGGTKGGCHGS